MRVTNILKDLKKPFTVMFWGGNCDRTMMDYAKEIIEDRLDTANISFIEVITDHRVNTIDVIKRNEFVVHVKYKDKNTLKTMMMKMRPAKNGTHLPVFEIKRCENNGKLRWYDDLMIGE